MSGVMAGKTQEQKSTGRTDSRLRELWSRPAMLGACADILALQQSAGNQAVHGVAEDGIPPIVQSVIDSGGQPLEPSLRTQMESGFGQDFSQVRVHIDGRAANSAEAVSAKAYTFGRDVVFSEGRYAPGTRQGMRLIAHELAHVVQQAGSVAPAGAEQAMEAEALNAATNIAGGLPANVGLSAPIGIQRSPEGEDEQNSQPVPQGTVAQRGPLPPRSAQKAETRPRFNLPKAARGAQELINKYPPGRLVDEGGALTEIFNRAGNLYDPQKRTAHAGELAVITDYLDYGAPDGRVVATLRVVPGRKGGASPDLHIKFTDGTETRVEMRTITSAPAIRKNAPATTVRPTIFPDQKTTRGGLVEERQKRLPTIAELKDAIRQKAVGATQLNAPLQEQLPGGQSRNVARGGEVVIDIPFGRVSASMIDQAMREMAPELDPNVRGIVFRLRVVSEKGTTTERLFYQRSGTGFVGRPWNVSAAPPPLKGGGNWLTVKPSGPPAANKPVTIRFSSEEQPAGKTPAPALQGAALPKNPLPAETPATPPKAPLHTGTTTLTKMGQPVTAAKSAAPKIEPHAPKVRTGGGSLQARGGRGIGLLIGLGVALLTSKIKAGDVEERATADMKAIEPQIQAELEALSEVYASLQITAPGQPVYANITVDVQTFEQFIATPDGALEDDIYMGTSLVPPVTISHDDINTTRSQRDGSAARGGMDVDDFITYSVRLQPLPLEYLFEYAQAKGLPQDALLAFEARERAKAAARERTAVEWKKEDEKRRQAKSEQIRAEEAARERSQPPSTPELRGPGPAIQGAQPVGPFFGPARMDKVEQAAYAAQSFRNRRAALIDKAKRNPSGDELSQFRGERAQWIKDIHEFFEKIVNPQLKSGQWSDAWQGVQDLKYLLAWAQGKVDEDASALLR